MDQKEDRAAAPVSPLTTLKKDKNATQQKDEQHHK